MSFEDDNIPSSLRRKLDEPLELNLFSENFAADSHRELLGSYDISPIRNANSNNKSIMDQYTFDLDERINDEDVIYEDHAEGIYNLEIDIPDCTSKSCIKNVRDSEGVAPGMIVRDQKTRTSKLCCPSPFERISQKLMSSAEADVLDQTKSKRAEISNIYLKNLSDLSKLISIETGAQNVKDKAEGKKQIKKSPRKESSGSETTLKISSQDNLKKRALGKKGCDFESSIEVADHPSKHRPLSNQKVPSKLQAMNEDAHPSLYSAKYAKICKDLPKSRLQLVKPFPLRPARDQSKKHVEDNFEKHSTKESVGSKFQNAEGAKVATHGPVIAKEATKSLTISKLRSKLETIFRSRSKKNMRPSQSLDAMSKLKKQQASPPRNCNDGKTNKREGQRKKCKMLNETYDINRSRTSASSHVHHPRTPLAQVQQFGSPKASACFHFLSKKPTEQQHTVDRIVLNRTCHPAVASKSIQPQLHELHGKLMTPNTCLYAPNLQLHSLKGQRKDESEARDGVRQKKSSSIIGVLTSTGKDKLPAHAAAVSSAHTSDWYTILHTHASHSRSISSPTHLLRPHFIS